MLVQLQLKVPLQLEIYGKTSKSCTVYCVTVAPGCGGEYTSNNGTIISPNYPNPYTDDSECVWTVTVDPGDVISLNFTNMDIEQHQSCRYDYVEVSSSTPKHLPLIPV